MTVGSRMAALRPYPRPSGGWPGALAAAGVAATAVIVTSALRVALEPALGARAPFILFTLPVLLSAVHGGLWAGLFATGFSLVAGGQIVSDLMRGHDTTWLAAQALFVGVGTAISVAGHMLRQARQRTAEHAAAALARERELRASEARFRGLVEAAPDAILILRGSRITFANQRAVQLTGAISAEELLGRSVAELFPEADWPLVQARLTLAEAQAAPLPPRRGWLVRRDGRRVRVESTKASITDDGKPAILTIERDISRSYEQETALRESEERYRTLVDALPQLVWTCDSDGKCDFISPQWCAFTGRPRDGQLGDGWAGALHPEDRERLVGAWKASVATGQVFDTEVRIRRADGVYRWFKQRAVPLGPGGGRPEKWFGTSTEISDLVEAREIVERAEQTIRAVVEAAPTGILTIDASGSIQLVNAHAERLFGYARAEMLGRPVEMLLPQERRPEHAALRAGFQARPQARPMGAGRDLSGLRKDGSTFPVEVGLGPIRTAEGAKVLVSIVDITERKQREANLLWGLREKEVLLGEIHHRVKNNMQVVHSLLELQAARISEPALLDVLRDSQNRVRSMALIHQTLYQSKDFANVDFRGFLDSLLPDLLSTYTAGNRPVRLVVQAEGVMLPIETAVPCGLIVNELISNALKHAFPDGHQGLIEVLLRRLDDGRVELGVRDDGVGLPPGLDLAQVNSLGLQLVSLLADQIGAELSIAPSRPTMFQLRFACS